MVVVVWSGNVDGRTGGAASLPRSLHPSSPTFFIRGASATVPSRLTNASPPFCCGSGRFIADPCGIFTGLGVGEPGLPSAARAGEEEETEAAEEEEATGLFPSEVGVAGETAGASLSSTSAIFATTTWTDIAAVSQSPFFFFPPAPPTQISESSGCERSGEVDAGNWSLFNPSPPAPVRMSRCHSEWG